MGKVSKRNLLLIGNTLETFGGGERWLLEAAVLLKEQYNITLLNPISKKSPLKTTRKALSNTFDLRGIEIIDLPSLGIQTTAFGTEPFLLVLPRAKSLVALKNSIKNADIIYCLSSNPILLGAVVNLALIYKKKLIFGVHNPSFYKLFDGNKSIKQTVISNAYSLLLRRVSYFHVLNADDEKIVHENYPSAKVFRIPNFIARAPSKIQINKREFIVLFVSRFQKYQKGVDFLSEIISRVLEKDKDIQFRLIGSGGDGEPLIRNLSLRYRRNLRWLGFVNARVLDREYANANLLVSTSRFEGFPLVMLEAQRFGLPVLAFDVKGSKEVIKNAYQGALIATFDLDSFASKILEFHALWEGGKKKYLVRKSHIARSIYRNYSARKILVRINKMLG